MATSRCPNRRRCATRGRTSSIRTAGALVAHVRDAVAPILDNGRFRLIIGGDCPLLLGCLTAASGRDRDRDKGGWLCERRRGPLAPTER